jgi:hypothetical protein
MELVGYLHHRYQYRHLDSADVLLVACRCPVSTEQLIEASSMDDTDKIIEWLMFGTAGNVNGLTLYAPVSSARQRRHNGHEETKSLTSEIAGELRHIWGFLIGLSAGQNGVKLTSQSNPLRSPIMKNGALLPLQHKTLHIHLNKKAPQVLITQSRTITTATTTYAHIGGPTKRQACR